MTIGEYLKSLREKPKKEKVERNFEYVKCKKCGAIHKTLRKVEDYYLCVDCYNKNK